MICFLSFIEVNYFPDVQSKTTSFSVSIEIDTCFNARISGYHFEYEDYRFSNVDYRFSHVDYRFSDEHYWAAIFSAFNVKCKGFECYMAEDLSKGCENHHHIVSALMF